MDNLSAEQATAIGKILESADGYCTTCAAILAEQMAAHWPDHDWMALVGQPDDEREPFDIGSIKGGAVVFSTDDVA